MKKAIIISGLLRLFEDNYRFLNLISKTYDVFVCTSSSDKEKLEKLDNVKGVKFIETDTYLNNEQNMLLELPEGTKILQWQKLLVAYSLLQKYEFENGFKYDCVYKIRTDLVFDENFEFDNSLHYKNENVVYMNSDIYFGGHRNAMEICSKFFFYSLSFFYNSTKYFPFDINLLKYSDLAAGKFAWLNYPIEIRGEHIHFDDFIGDIESLTRSSLPFSGDTFNFRESSSKIIFPSEPAFLNYILANNYAVRSIHKFPYRIDENRHLNVQISDDYEDILGAYKRSDFELLILMYKNGKAKDDRCADIFRDAALKIFKENHALGLTLISCALSIRPGGPYIRKLKSDFESVVLSRKFGNNNQ